VQADSNVVVNESSPTRYLSESRRMEAEEIMNLTANQDNDLLRDNDHESITLKSTILAKYLTMDMILDVKYGVTEP
jgi:hypothetical protein